MVIGECEEKLPSAVPELLEGGFFVEVRIMRERARYEKSM